MKRLKSKWTLVSLAVLCALPLIGEAQQQQPPQQSQRTAMEPGRYNMMRWGPRGEGSATRPYLRLPSDEEWTKVSTFMKDELPNSWALYQRMSDKNPGRGEEAKRRIFQRYQELHKDKDSSEIFEAKLKQAKIGDEILPLVAKMHEAPDSEKPALESQLREKVKEKIGVELKERELRIQDLAAKLDREKAKLAEDRVKMEASLDARVNSLIHPGGEGGGNARPSEGMRRGEGEGRRAPGGELR